MPRINIETSVGLITLRGKWKTLFILNHIRRGQKETRLIDWLPLSSKLTNVVPPNNVALMALLGLFVDMGKNFSALNFWVISSIEEGHRLLNYVVYSRGAVVQNNTDLPKITKLESEK